MLGPMILRFWSCALAVLVFALSVPSVAVEVPPDARANGAVDKGEPRAITKLLVDHEELAPGAKFRVGVLFELDDDWHVYGEDPGDSGLPTDVKWTSDHATFGGIDWPPVQTFVDPAGIITTYGYESWVLFVSEATLAADAPEQVEITATVSYLACKIKCLPGNAELRRTVKVGSTKPAGPDVLRLFEERVAEPKTKAHQPTIETAEPETPKEPAAPTREPLPLWQVLWLAFLGGILLNLMPCVFPVLALKVFGFVSTGREGRAEAMRHAGAYAGGIGVSMAVLAGVVLALRAGGQAVGWGFQFQEPAYVAGLTLVVTTFALNLFGVFDVPMLPVPSRLGAHVGESPPVGRSFVDGIFAVVLATPCSAPFLGTAVGFALAAEATTIVLSFMAVGVGLAAPYVVASSWPALARRLPQPGPWMETFERVLGFLLLGTSVWLVWVYGRVGGADAVAALLATTLAASVAAWIWGRVQYRTPKARRLGAVSGLVILGIAIAVFQPHDVEPVATTTAAADDHWVAFDEQEIVDAQKRGEVVFVDFTADWCITCKVNERTILSQDRVMAALTAPGVVMMKADWTRRDERIRTVLAKFGRAGVPMYLVYPAGGGEPEVLPEVLTPDLVIEAVERAKGANGER